MSQAAAGACAPSDLTWCVSEAQARLAAALRAERQMLARIAKCLERENMRQAQKLIRLYLISFSAKLAALYAANAKFDRRRKRRWNGGFGQDRRMSLERLLDLAARMNVFEPSRERVTLMPIPKARGGYRIVQVYGIERKARQELLKRVLDLLRGRVLDCQFLFVGRRAALQAVSQAIAANGYQFAAELDVADQFGSFDQNTLHEFLPELPAKSVGANLVPAGTIFNRKKLSSIQENPTRRLKWTQQGLPTGASTSSVVAEILMAKALTDLPWEMLSHVTVIVYADNILVLGHTEASVDDACTCLSDGFGRSAVGRLRLENRGVKRLSRGVEFLGMRIVTSGGEISMAIPARKRAALIDRVHADWTQHGCVNRVRSRTRSYAASASLDRKAGFGIALVAQAVTSMKVSRGDLRALDRLARRSVTPSGRISSMAVMLDAPRGDAWRQICNSVQAAGIGRSQRASD